MNVGKLSIGPTAQFGQQNMLAGLRERQQKQKEKRAPLEDALQRLATNAFDAKAKGLEKDAEAKKLADKMDVYVSSLNTGENRALKDMDDEELMIFQHIFTQMTRLAQGYEDKLLDFRDQLSAFDQTIQDYQSMLDGKHEMSEGLTREKVTELLDQMKSAREQFLHDTEKKLGTGGSEHSTASAGFLGLSRAVRRNSVSAQIMKETSGESALEDYANKDPSFWQIDFRSDDIYGEIDRVLEGVQGVGRHFGEALDAISKELAKRGYTEDKYQRYFDKLREQFMPGWQRDADPAAIVRMYMEKAAEEADNDA